MEENNIINFIDGNLLDANVDIICHQVNCQCVMGAGLAKQIKENFSNVYNEYRNLYIKTEDKKSLLGCAQFVEVYNKSYKYVVNLFGQLYCGVKLRQTNYEALYIAIETMFESAFKNLYVGNKITIGIPYKLGCGLAGGNWNIVLSMIQELALKYQNYINVNIYKYEE